MATDTRVFGAPTTEIHTTATRSVISPEEAAFKARYADAIASLRKLVAIYPDFPKPGIRFKDFWPIFQDAGAKKLLGDLLYEYYKTKNIEVVAGYESRGFPPGNLLADRLGVGFVPLRKPGKLPGPIFTVDYGLEYGKDSLSISQTALRPGQRVLLIDDLIATGGTAEAGIKLVRQVGAIPVEFASILDVEIGGRSKLSIPSFNLIENA